MHGFNRKGFRTPIGRSYKREAQPNMIASMIRAVNIIMKMV